MEQGNVLERGIISLPPLLITSLAETALRFVVASMLFEYDFETCAESDLITVQDLEKDISKPWRRNLILKFNPRLQKDEDLDMQGYSIIDAM
jgi:hypothetical protein